MRRIDEMRNMDKEPRRDKPREDYWQGQERSDIQKAMQVCIPAHSWVPLWQTPLVAGSAELIEAHTFHTAWTFQKQYREEHPYTIHTVVSNDNGSIQDTTLVVTLFPYRHSEADVMKKLLSGAGQWPVPDHRIIAVSVPRILLGEGRRHPPTALVHALENKLIVILKSLSLKEKHGISSRV